MGSTAEAGEKYNIHPAFEIMPFEKYVKSKGWEYSDEEVRIKGTFKNVQTGKIIKNDIFTAKNVRDGSAEKIYKAYLSWFNDTKIEEDEREYLYAEFM